MSPQHILVIDDLNPKPVINLLTEAHPTATITRLRRKDEVRQYLQARAPEDTVILLNAHIRFSDSDYRSNFLGMRFLRQELRSRWRRREAVLVDWYLFEPNLPYRKEQPMQGGDIYERVKALKPYLPQFVVTQEDDLDTVVHTIMSKHRFHGYFAKRWLDSGNAAKRTEFVQKIRTAVQEMKEVLASQPRHDTWKKYQPAYYQLRFDDPAEWERFEREIDAEVDRLATANFDRDNTLRKALPIRKANTIEPPHCCNGQKAPPVVDSQRFRRC
jgi:hypothetical protein